MTAVAAHKIGLAEKPATPRVMLVDDSGVSRAMMAGWLQEAGVEIVFSARDAEEALLHVARLSPDIILLDIEMPRMSGIDVLPQLLAAVPGVKIIMVSTLSRRNARITIDALRAGAIDTLAKPDSGWAGQTAPAFRNELIRKVLALGANTENTVAVPLAPVLRPRVMPKVALAVPDIVGIGASTGGPKALFTLLQHLTTAPVVPILITQHMPPMFTTILAEHVTRLTGIPAAEAIDGEALVARRIYIAPGGRHMRAVADRGRKPVISLSDNPAENFCRPSVNPLFRSLAEGWGKRALGIVLTGMGSDGLDGAHALNAAGAPILVQDAETSVVWGMPGAVANAGLASAVLPLDELGTQLARLLRRV